MSEFIVQVSMQEHVEFAEQISKYIERFAQQRGTGIAKRTPDYIRQKIVEGKSVIALHREERLAGFCYIESWEGQKYIANSGLIVMPEFRKKGLAKAIKLEAFKLSRSKFPDSSLFGLTTSLAVMKINSELGYRPVTFSELTQEETFWAGCQSCVNYDILCRTNFKRCLCTGMLYVPEEAK